MQNIILGDAGRYDLMYCMFAQQAEVCGLCPGLARVDSRIHYMQAAVDTGFQWLYKMVTLSPQKF